MAQGRRPRARRECVVWEKLDTDNIPGNPWRGVPNYNGYQPDADGQPRLHRAELPRCRQAVRARTRRLRPASGAGAPPGLPVRPAVGLCRCCRRPARTAAPTGRTTSYSPSTNLYYFPYGSNPVAHYRGAGGNGLRALGQYQTGGILAINASTGKVVWQQPPRHRHGARPGPADARRRPAVRRPARRHALRPWTPPPARRCGSSRPDARQLGRGHVQIDGEQYVAVIAAGTTTRTAIVSEGDTLWAFKLGGTLQDRVGQQRGADAGAACRPSRRRRCRRRRQHGRTTPCYLARVPTGRTRRPRATASRTNGMSPTLMRVPVGHDGDVHEPGGRDVPELPEPEGALRDAVLRGRSSIRSSAPGQTFQYTFTRAGEYFFNDCTDPRPTGKVVAYHVPQDVPGALQFVPSTLSMRPANGVFTSVQGLVTAMFRSRRVTRSTATFSSRRRCRQRCSRRSRPA